MKKANFWKGLALAAVALVSVFSTSCSEEELNINGVEIPEQVLPAAKASVSISVVDLEVGQIIGKVKNIDATSAIGSSITVQCPVNDGYTTAKDIVVEIPAIEKGQSVVIPVTFYVVTLESAFAGLMEESTIEHTITGTTLTNELTFINENGWVDGVYTNAEAENVTSIARFGNFYTGYHFISTSSRAATTVEDLLQFGLEFEVGIYEESVIIPAMHVFTHAKVYQEIHITESVLKDHEGEIIMGFQSQQAGNVIIEGYATPITHDAPGHDNTHDGHGHGHGSNSNAGGGIGGNEGE